MGGGLMSYSEHILLEDDDLMWQPTPFPPHVETVGCALPDLRYVIYAGAVAAGALLAVLWLVRDACRNRLLS